MTAPLDPTTPSDRRSPEGSSHEDAAAASLTERPVAICTCDAAGRIESFNPEAVELLGYEPGPDAEAGAATYSIHSVEGPPIPFDRSPVAEVLKSGEPQVNRELVIERPDGSRRAVIVSILPRHDGQGKLIGAIQYLTDITATQPPDEALRKRRAMFETLFESAPDAILVVARGTGIIFRANRQAAEMFGYSIDELQGQPVEILIPERFRDHHQHYHTQYLANAHIRPMGSGIELFARRKDGREFPVDVMLGGLETEQGRFALTTIRDLSDRRAAEAERQARQAAEAANRARSEFLAKMSHELRSPLNTILGFTRLMAANPAVAAVAGDDLERVIKSGQHLYALIDQVLDISKLDVGRTTVNDVDFDLYLLLDDLHDQFALAARAKGLQLQVRYPPEVPRYVHADALKLRQILINLIDNAVKFTDGGRVTVVAERVAASSDTALPMLRFTVTDTGPGIAADELATLFHPFTQARAGRLAAHGAGLGLAISHGFAQLMSGEMQIESAVGVGTTVRLEIPAPVASGVVQPSAGFRKVRALADGEPRYRMLVVDDQAEARHLIARLFGPLGVKIKEASNGLEAVDLWQRSRPNVIWMDLAMPVLDGLDATRRIRAAAKGAQPVIIALSALSGEDDRARALAAGCNDVLHKPMREADLFAALEKHLGMRFIYEDTAAIPAPTLDADTLSRIPAAQRSALEAALLALDSEAVERVVEAIDSSSPATAAILEEYVRDFQYEKILAALRDVKPNEQQDPR